MGQSRKGLTRRELLKIAGATGMAGPALAVGAGDAEAKLRENRLAGATITTSVCPYCAVGCGLQVHTKDSKIIHIEGDPDHPVNQGALCPKGATLIQIAENPKRVTKPLYRAAGAKEWKEVSWDWALDAIARKVKDTRDATFVPTSRIKVKEKVGDKEVEKEVTAVVNRTMGIAHVGSAALDNEECYLLQKMMRGLGLVAIEHQARI